MKENRPWGFYEILLDTDYTKVKQITVNPSQKLSYQYLLDEYSFEFLFHNVGLHQ